MKTLSDNTHSRIKYQEWNIKEWYFLFCPFLAICRDLFANSKVETLRHNRNIKTVFFVILPTESILFLLMLLLITYCVIKTRWEQNHVTWSMKKRDRKTNLHDLSLICIKCDISQVCYSFALLASIITCLLEGLPNFSTEQPSFSIGNVTRPISGNTYPLYTHPMCHT